MSNTSSQPRHVVTAVIVAHDGARMLSGLVKALRGQTYPVQRVIGVDTGSRDRGGATLAELIGADAVFGMDRRAGYGAAVATAVRHAPPQQDRQRVEWIWLLHDDCEPAQDALEALLRGASRDRSVAVLGPKVLDHTDRRVLRETGITIDRAGRRLTGIEPGEIDQGQHDGNRSVLAVGSAGMLIRRDVWDRVGGFDEFLSVFRDDADFCWRVHAAGYRVQVITGAVVFHRELSARQRRPVEGGGPRRLDRRNALYVLAVNPPALTALRIVTGCVVGSLLRAVYFLLTKQQGRAWDHLGAVAGVFGHPVRLLQARRRRAAGRRTGWAAVRTFVPPGRTVARWAETAAGLLSGGPPQASGGLHRAYGGQEEDEQFIEPQSALRRVLANPGFRLFAALVIIALVAERRLLAAGPLGGGALVPAWGSASALWREYMAGFHDVGIGSAGSAPPYVALVAALATVLGGKPWLAVDVLLLGCVPLAGLTAYLAARRITTVPAIRVLAGASYALLPVGIGAIAAGRLGTTVALVMLPLIGIAAARMLTLPPRGARRAAWATGLLVALTAAFVPLIWLLAFAGAIAVAGVAALRHEPWTVRPVNAAIVAAVPALTLIPWTFQLLASPAGFLLEAGVQRSGLAVSGLSAGHLLLLSPGGPGLPPTWVTAGFALSLLALLLPHRRTMLARAGWCVAITGLLVALIVSRVTVTQGGLRVAAWPGPALAVTAAGLLLAVIPVAEWLAGQVAKAAASRRAAAIAGLVLAVTVPVLAGAFWLADGVRGPVAATSAQVLPPFVSAASSTGTHPRTLVLRQQNGVLTYSVLRENDPMLGEPELGTQATASSALATAVASLAAPAGADPGQTLSTFAIKWVMLPSPIDQGLAERLDEAGGLVPVSSAPAYDLWEVAGPVSRTRVVTPNGTVVPLPSGRISESGVSAPRSGGTLLLAEPSGGWTARLNGHALTPLPHPVGGWAQGFVLPAGGGTLAITRDNTARDFSLYVELVALLAVCGLALPGKRAEATAQVPAASESRSQRRRRGERGSGRRARLRRRLAASGSPAADRPLPASAGLGSASEGSLSASGGSPSEETGRLAVSDGLASASDGLALALDGLASEPAVPLPETTGPVPVSRGRLPEPTGPVSVPGGRHGHAADFADARADGPADASVPFESIGAEAAADPFAADSFRTREFTAATSASVPSASAEPGSAEPAGAESARTPRPAVGERPSDVAETRATSAPQSVTANTRALPARRFDHAKTRAKPTPQPESAEAPATAQPAGGRFHAPAGRHGRHGSAPSGRRGQSAGEEAGSQAKAPPRGLLGMRPGFLGRARSSGQAEPAGTAEQGDRTSRTEPSSRTGPAGRTESVEQTESVGRTGSVERAEPTGRTGSVERTESAGRTGSVRRTGSVERAEPTGGAEPVGRAEPSSRAKLPGRTGSSGRRASGPLERRPRPRRTADSGTGSGAGNGNGADPGNGAGTGRVPDPARLNGRTAPIQVSGSARTGDAGQSPAPGAHRSGDGPGPAHIPGSHRRGANGQASAPDSGRSGGGTGATPVPRSLRGGGGGSARVPGSGRLGGGTGATPVPGSLRGGGAGPARVPDSSRLGGGTGPRRVPESGGLGTGPSPVLDPAESDNTGTLTGIPAVSDGLPSGADAETSPRNAARGRSGRGGGHRAAKHGRRSGGRWFGGKSGGNE